MKNCFEKHLPQPLIGTRLNSAIIQCILPQKNFGFVEEDNSQSYEIVSIRYLKLLLYGTLPIWNKLENNITSDLTEIRLAENES